MATTRSKALPSPSEAHRKVGFGGLRGRFLMLVIGIYLGVGGLAAIGFMQLTERMVVRLGTGYATQYARQQQARISAKLEREVVLAQKLVDSPLLREWATHETNPQLRSQALQELDSYRKLFSDRSFFFIVDRSKNYYFNNAADEFKGQELRYVVSRDDPRSNWYFETIKNVDDFALHVDNSPQLGESKVWINAVVKEGENKVGLGGSGLTLTDFLKEVVQSPDPGVRTVLVNRLGFVQGHSDSSLMEQNAKIKDEEKRLKIFDLFQPSQRSDLEAQISAAIASPTSVSHFEIEENGHRVIVGAAYLKSIDWLALVFVDPSQVVELRQFLPILAVVALALLASVVLVSYAMDRLILKRLMVLTESTQEIAQGDYEVDLEVDREDEIGQLTQSFNHMTATIRDYTQNLETRVEKRTEELRQSNLLLEQTNRVVMDSIHYALLIQTALLAKPSDLRAAFSESFTFWRPRDVVGGDYYTLYTEPDENGFLLAVADCTGHGVPGAFMSMASKALLDRAVAELGLDDPAALLQQLHTSLQDLLRQEEPGSQNGLDIALVQGRRGQNRLCYAGARIPLWLHRPGQPFEVVKADKVSLGYARTAREIVLTNHEIALQPGTRVILTTDGMLDQPGGDKGFGLGQRRLQEAFMGWDQEPLDGLAQRLDTLIAEYTRDFKQRDDITVVGFTL